MLGGKMIIEKWRFWRQETKGGPKVLNKAAKIVLKKARYKIGDSTRKLSHKHAKSSTGSWKVNECLKLEAPEMAKLKKSLYLICQVTLSSSQISEEVQKPCCRRGPGWLSFVDECPKYIYFFSCRKWTNIVWGSAGSCAPGDKKAQNGSSVGLHAVSHTMPQRLQNVIKKKKNKSKQKGHVSYWNSQHMFSIEK